MTKIEMTKTGISLIAGVGIARTINGIAQTFAKNDNVLDKVFIFTGSYVVGGIINEHGRKYVDKTVDEIVAIHAKYVTK